MRNITELVGLIKNPKTSATLKDENRIIELKYNEENKTLNLVYSRDGLTPEDKKIIEAEVIKSLASIIDSDNITIQSKSTNNSSDVYAHSHADTKSHVHSDSCNHDHSHSHSHNHNKTNSAELKVGHGPATSTKKKVSGAKKVIAVSSCKGGVGKSTVAVNLAYALKNLGLKVGILDADIYGPSIPMLLNQRNFKPTASEDKKILPGDADGLSFMSFGLFVDENDPVIWRGPMLGGVLNQFLFDVKWTDLDFLIIDLPPGTGDMQLSLVQATDIDGALVVSTPQDVALLDSKKGLKMFTQMNTPVVGLIENMSYFSPEDNPSKKYFIFGEGGVKKAALNFNLPLLAEIPLETPMREGSDAGTPYMNNNKMEGRAAWNAYMELAKKVNEHFNPTEKPVGFFKKLFS